MVPTTMLIWTMPPAITLGPARRVRRRTPGVQRGRRGRQRYAGAVAGEEEEGELDDAADGHRSREEHAGAHGADVAAGVDEDERRDQERVEEGLREGRRDEAAEAVERAGQEGDDRDQEEVGKGDPAQQHRQVELRRDRRQSPARARR